MRAKEPPDMSDPSPTQRIAFTAVDVSKSYPGVTALDGVSLT